MYGLENQTKVVDMMPLRVIGYNGASYRSQFQRQVKKAVPVITLVLYFGNSRWNKPKSLKELMDIPDELDEYVNDYNSKGVSNMCEVAERLENIGRAEERMELIKTMLLNGKSPQEISDFCKISIEEIEKVQGEMK